MKWLCLLSLCLITPAYSQDVVLLPCARVSFFEPACAPEVPAIPAPPPPPPAPLFTPDTMARDTPPLLLALLETPTVAHAKAFMDWQQQRLQRIADVQQLLKMLTRGAALVEKD